MPPYIQTDSKSLPNDVDEVGEEYAISVDEIAPINRLGYIELAGYELNSAIIARLCLNTRENDRDGTLRIIGCYWVVYPTPVL